MSKEKKPNRTTNIPLLLFRKSEHILNSSVIWDLIQIIYLIRHFKYSYFRSLKKISVVYRSIKIFVEEQLSLTVNFSFTTVFKPPEKTFETIKFIKPFISFVATEIFFRDLSKRRIFLKDKHMPFGSLL